MVLRLIKVFSICAFSLFLGQEVFAQATMNSLDQNADQSQGQYTPMNMGYAGFNSLGMTQAAWLDPLQNLGEGQTRPAYSKYYWSPDLVLPIRLREGMMTLINFPSWELIEDIYIGDNATFDGQISGPNTLLMYPRKGANVGVDTNVIVFGRSGNRYVFYVKSEGVNTERLTNSIIDIEVIDNPDAVSGGGMSGGAGRGTRNGMNASLGKGGKSVDSTYTKRQQKADWIKEIPVDPEKFRFDIEMYVPNPEDVIIAPERVWRDDVFTYIDLGDKALNMTQRPIVTLIVERIEVPVGFRAKGPNNRLIIVEAIGDMVLRNGKRIVCLKLRRSDETGLDNISYANENLPANWEVPAPLPGGANSGSFGGTAGGQTFDGGGGVIYQDSQAVGMHGAGGGGQGGDTFTNGNGSENYRQSLGLPPANQPYRGAAANIDMSKMQRISNNQNYDNSGALNKYGYGSGFSNAKGGDISLELGVDSDVEKLEDLWDKLSSKYADVLSVYEPFFSVDTPADGQGKELFHLRVGPVKSLETGDNICSKLGRNGIFCSVIRTQ